MGFKLSKLIVQNFRNLQDKPLEFSHGVNCIYGSNGNGKTNILEAIYFLTNRKSFRKNAAFPQIISIDGQKPELTFQSLFLQNEDKLTISAKINQETSLWYVNQELTKKKPEIKSVFINPFDSGSFHTSTSFRREWFDYHIGLVDPNYKKKLNNYVKLLRMRNNLLENNDRHAKDQIMAIDQDFSRYIYEITNMRLNFLKDIKPFYGKIFHDLFSEKHELEVILKSKFIGKNPQAIIEFLKEALPQDFKTKHTSSGIHRDDLIIHFDGLNSFDYCSLGQQKMAFLSLIFAYIELFRYKFMFFPLVLIDDVSGELDSVRWKNLISFLKTKEFQVFITTANENFRHELEAIKNAKRIHVDQGSVA